MRTFLGWLVLVLVLGTIAFLVAPIVARPLVADAVRAVSPFGTAPLDVEVDVETPGLLGGHIDRIHVTGSDLSSRRLDAEKLDVTVTDVGVLDRAFGSIGGGLVNAVLHRADGTDIEAARVELSGSSEGVKATARLDREAALALMRHTLEDAGLSTEGLTLVDGGVRLTVDGQQIVVALGAENGSAVVSGSISGGHPIVVFGPEAGDPWRITGVTTSPDGVDVFLALAIEEVLGSG